MADNKDPSVNNGESGEVTPNSNENKDPSVNNGESEEVTPNSNENKDPSVNNVESGEVTPNSNENKDPSVNTTVSDVDIALLDSAIDEFDSERKPEGISLTPEDTRHAEQTSSSNSKPSSSSTSKDDIKDAKTASASLSHEANGDEADWSKEYLDLMSKIEMLASADAGDSSQMDSLLESLMNDVVPSSSTSTATAQHSNENDDTMSLEDQLKKRIENITQDLNNLPVANLGKMMSEGSVDGDDASDDMGPGLAQGGNMLPFLEDIMQQFLCKDVLYPVFSETCDKYPDWLQKNKGKLPEPEFDNYSKQFDIMSQVVQQFDTETDSDSADVKKMRFNVILDLLQEMQKYGSPPQQLVGADTFPTLPGGKDSKKGDCCVM